MQKQNVTIGLIGIPDIEERRLNSAFTYSQTRNKCYAAQSLDDRPNILMVNADEPSALIKWRVYRDNLERQGYSEPSSVLVSQDREFKTKHYQVKRPLIATRVISVLDQVAENELQLQEQPAILAKTITMQDATLENTSFNVTASQKTSSNNGNELKALVVDDSLPVRIQMDKALKQYANVDFAVTGEEAYTLIDKNQYDIIFLDVVLPGVDGYEVCKTIKEGNAKSTPVIMLTGNSSPADRIKGKLSGCDTYLIKPVGEAVFQEIINQYVKIPNNINNNIN